MKTTYRYPRTEPKQTPAQAAAFVEKIATLQFKGDCGIIRQAHPDGGHVENVVSPKQVRPRVDPTADSREGLK